MEKYIPNLNLFNEIRFINFFPLFKHSFVIVYEQDILSSFEQQKDFLHSIIHKITVNKGNSLSERSIIETIL
ncbi:hypothetical protein KFF76_20065 [Bacillus subtilis]|uniref:hypothetical protein n=1 Tax=Bacillus subtilis TaxID=1423 RepID=UPI001BA945D4|nr:hypothetical protein [Bacillus subtilis]QWF74488.1 hypothetical protein KFF76_20065 [Bacillus subtilis]